MHEPKQKAKCTSAVASQDPPILSLYLCRSEQVPGSLPQSRRCPHHLGGRRSRGQGERKGFIVNTEHRPAAARSTSPSCPSRILQASPHLTTHTQPQHLPACTSSSPNLKLPSHPLTGSNTKHTAYRYFHLAAPPTLSQAQRTRPAPGSPDTQLITTVAYHIHITWATESPNPPLKKIKRHPVTSTIIVQGTHMDGAR